MPKASSKKITKKKGSVPGFAPDDDILSQIIWQLAAQSNTTVKKKLDNKADLTSLLPLAFLVAAVIEFLKRPQPPKWNEWMWYAYSVFRDLNTEKRKIPHFHGEGYDKNE